MKSDGIKDLCRPQCKIFSPLSEHCFSTAISGTLLLNRHLSNRIHLRSRDTMAESQPSSTLTSLSISMSQIARMYPLLLSQKTMQSEATLSAPDDPLPDLQVYTYDEREGDTFPEHQVTLRDLANFRYKDVTECIFDVLSDYLESTRPSTGRLIRIHAHFKEVGVAQFAQSWQLLVSQWEDVTTASLCELLDRLVAYVQAIGVPTTAIQVVFSASFEGDRAVPHAVAGAFRTRRDGLACHLEADWTARHDFWRYE